MGFKDELAAFQEVVLKKQDDPIEIVTDVDALGALIVLNFIKYEKVPDAFLAVSALNLLNRYVKQKDSRIGYQFRIHLINVLKGIEDIAQRKSIMLGYEASRDNLLIIQFWNFQFSFKSERLTEQVQKMLSKKNITWDGIKKQPCSKSIFQFALNSIWISNKTMMDENLLQLVQAEQIGLKRGDYKIVHSQFVKIKNIKYRMAEGTNYQKNYMRFKLCECQDRPVILLAKFEKIWDKHITFTMVSPYIKQLITMPVCDHINLYRPDVEKVIDITKFVPHERYYIIGFCKKYPNSDRMGIDLAMDLGSSPILRVQEFKKIPRSVFEKCHRFSIEEYIGFCQKEIFL